MKSTIIRNIDLNIFTIYYVIYRDRIRTAFVPLDDIDVYENKNVVQYTKRSKMDHNQRKEGMEHATTGQVEEAFESSCFQRRSERQVESSEDKGASVESVKSAFTIYWLPLYLLKFSVSNLTIAQVIIETVNKASMYWNVWYSNSTIWAVILAVTTKGRP
ncbi:hypothetical protein FQA39_LY14144 [Lamprigera yunnana]|nr:hypothetical protein FQA39_LY14144 [Lamprigera yunnana]